MRHERFASKIAYVCIFAESIEEASEHLVRLITHRDCGFDEGPDSVVRRVRGLSSGSRCVVATESVWG